MAFFALSRVSRHSAASLVQYLRSQPNLTAARQPNASLTKPRGIHITHPRAILYVNADKKTFEQVTATNDRVVLVDFYADWCGPCRQLSPVIERLTKDLDTSGSGLPLDLVKIDTETEDGQELARKYQVTALPTIVAFKEGKPANKFLGALPEHKIKEFVESL
ncbi:thioredoxin [Coprinopsis marcescibilis]|uniref:Thioredoxin n=1 Tax=Coprinopsis marcescibilis TaxID=230819 RepID=A0A5C3LCM8_COPMA|nr:thioredoxin [Coprinopsis marcescibilis]